MYAGKLQILSNGRCIGAYVVERTDSATLKETPSLAEIEQFRTWLLDWHVEHGRTFPWRQRSASCYKKIIAELLLQRTRAEAVAAFYPRFLARFPSWAELAQATEEELRSFLQPIGLWRRRAESMRKLANEMVKRRGRFPRTRHELESLPGIGQYVASAILLLCYCESQPLLDANMARVLECRFGPRKLADIRYDPYLRDLAKAVVSGEDPITINWAILDYAALVCRPKLPDCPSCLWASRCPSRPDEQAH